LLGQTNCCGAAAAKFRRYASATNIIGAHMKGILLVGLGGFIGSVARYKLGGLVLHLSAQERFPYSTFAVNLLGCLAIGLLAGLTERYELFGPGTRLFLFTGLLGGFTTFSAFGLDALLLLRRSEFLVAALYAGASVVLGITAVWLGLKLISVFPR
jgi:CrcB protein